MRERAKEKEGTKHIDGGKMSKEDMKEKKKNK